MQEDSHINHHTLQVKNVRLHFVTAGEGDPVVLLHGWPQTWYEWRRIIPALAKKFTVIAPDLRGLGDSSRPLSGYDKRTVASDIHHLVQELGFKQIFLVGHDWGAGVAYAYASLYPEEVRNLAILEMLIPGFGLEETMHISRESGLWHMVFHMVPDIPEMLITGKERAYLSDFYWKFAYNPAAITEIDIDEYVRCYTAPGALRAGLGYYRTIFEDADHNREAAKTKLTMPVLALGGDHSLGDAPLKSMTALAENVKGGVVEQCGHWIPEECPEYLINQLTSFFIV